MKTIAIMNVKGGVGKTMTACNMAHILASDYNQRVLLVDADPSGNASAFFGASAEDGGLTELLQGLVTCYADIVQETDWPRLHIIPCDSSLFSVELAVGLDQDHSPHKAILDMCAAIAEDGDYDLVIIDCPPSFTPSAVAALRAADSVIVPVKMDAFSVLGMDFLLDQLAAVRRINGKAQLDGILVTIWHNCDCNVQGEQELRSRGIRVFEQHIRRSDKTDESTWMRAPICEYSRTCSTARDYRNFVAEFVRDGGLRNGKI